MSGWWVNSVMQAGGPALLVAWCLWMIISITLHELAHGWVAVRCGDRTPIETGHMTWNPVVHMGVPMLLMFALLGIAGGAMPVDPTRLRRKWQEAWVALAGPLMNIALGALCVVVGAAAIAYAPPGARWADRLEEYARLGAMLNMTLALFNLVPVPPLDGWRIASTLAPPYRRVFAGEGGQLIGLIMFGCLFFFGAPYIWSMGADVSGEATRAVAKMMGAPIP